MNCPGLTETSWPSTTTVPVPWTLVSEFLRRPMQTVAATARKVPTPQSVPAVRERTIAAPDDPNRVVGDPTIPAGPQSPSVRPRRRVEAAGAITPDVDLGAVTYYGQGGTWRPRWRPVLVTGLVAFAVVVAFYTVPDLLAGRSITGNGQPTTFFGGSAPSRTAPTCVEERPHVIDTIRWSEPSLVWERPGDRLVRALVVVDYAESTGSRT